MDLSTWPSEESLPEEACDAAFRRAYDELAQLGFGVDGFLKLGSLDCPASWHYVREALGALPESGDIWPGEKVASLAANATWPNQEQVPQDELWAYLSARKFVEVCVSCRLAMTMC